MLRRITTLACLLSIAANTMAQDSGTSNEGSEPTTRAFVGARILTVSGDEIDSGTLIVQNGKIIAVGKSDAIDVAAGVERVDVSGKVIMPGLICTHSHLGGIGGADSSSPIQPGVRIFDSLNVKDAGFKRALAGGLTTLNIMPGSGHLMSGQTIYVKLRLPARTVDDLMIRTSDGRVAGGMKMANGTNSIRETGGFPGTRGKSAALVRQKYIEAREYAQKLEAAKTDPTKKPARNLGLEAMVEILEGKRVVHHHTHRHDDIITVLRLSKEFGFRVVLHHVSEGWRVAKEIAEAKAPCSIILVDSPGGKLEAVNLVFETAAVLEKAGVDIAFHTDDSITDSRLFLRMPALGVRAGLSRKTALASVTLNAAKMLDIADRTGSIEVGKDADFVVLNGDPLSVYTKVLETWVEGVQVFDRSKPEDRLYAVGGYGAGSTDGRHLCCEGDER